MATPEQLADEARRARRVRQIVDISTSLIMQGNMTRQEAESLERLAREHILGLFPDTEDTYEIIYSHKFRRIIDEFTSAPRARPAAILPFPPRR